MARTKPRNSRSRRFLLLAVMGILTLSTMAETTATAVADPGIPLTAPTADAPDPVAASTVANTGSAETGSASDPIAGGTGSASSGSGSGSASGSATGSASVPLASPRAMAALSIAKTQVGKPYQWGGTGPNAFDCSGLVQWAYRWVGIFLPRTTWQQARAGSPVPLGSIQPGDVVVLNPDGSHEGMYVGNGTVINAYDYGVGVVYSPLRQFHIYAIRRFF
ncbi:C40 family peptidase [Nocardia albiluteola]|nr:NlpC/P60 family protein [Nocardia albiluteola]